jgi:hypothetical protein
VGGTVWQGSASGPGRDLRTPEQRPGYRVWPFAAGDTPGSVQLDAALAGTEDDKPVDRPVLARSTSRQPAAGSAAPWIHNAPSASRVHRTGGSAQLRPAAAQPGDSVSSQLGAEYFNDGASSPAAGPVCAYEPCGKTLSPGPRGGPAKRFCSASHRYKAWSQAAANG